jgi:endonuclease/exonuclease/phosphatase (EEP) superfamily protein YafD
MTVSTSVLSVCRTLARRRGQWAAVMALVLASMGITAPAHAQSDVVLYGSDVSVVRGNWAQAASSSGASGMALQSADWAWANTSALASPNDYFEASFTVQANTAYHVWLRLRGTANSKYSESVWVQFDDTVSASGSPMYRIGTSNALLVNLENCRDCGIASWGWQDKAYWMNQSPIVRFTTAGSHRIRVQIREDGVGIDQIVLSPSTYMTRSPGLVANDTVIVSKSSGGTSPTTSPSPFGGSPATVPGTVQAEGFDNGGEGVAYHDTDAPNSGGIYRSTGVDIAWASGGTGLVGWVAAGEWLTYTVNVQSAGTYNAEFLVASAGQGGSFHLEANGADVSGVITIPDTGGWQSWRVVTARVSLNAGRQVFRLAMDRTGQYAVGNFDWFRISTATPAVVPTSGGGGNLRVMTWNIKQGRDLYNNPNLEAQARFIVSQNPDVVILQEVSIYDGHQPSMYRDQLQSATGRTWYSSWAPSCSTGGCLGNLILSRIPMSAASMVFMPPSAAASATVVVGGIPVTLFAAHLDVNTDVRTREMYQLLDWSRTFSGAKIIGMDFNSWWGEWWIQYTTSTFADVWREVTGSNENGYTIGNVRFDYLFRQGNAIPLSCWVPYTELSDHRPVVADFQVR